MCDIGIAQCDDRTVKCKKKVREPPNVTKKLLYVILEPHNVRMELSNVRKIIRELPNVKKMVTCDV